MTDLSANFRLHQHFGQLKLVMDSSVVISMNLNQKSIPALPMQTASIDQAFMIAIVNMVSPVMDSFLMTSTNLKWRNMHVILIKPASLHKVMPHLIVSKHLASTIATVLMVLLVSDSNMKLSMNVTLGYILAAIILTVSTPKVLLNVAAFSV